MSTTSQNFVKSDALIKAQQDAADAARTEELTTEVTNYTRQIGEQKKRGRELAKLHTDLSAFVVEHVGTEGVNYLTETLENIAYAGRSIRDTLGSYTRYEARAKEKLAAHLASLAGVKPVDADEFA